MDKHHLGKHVSGVEIGLFSSHTLDTMEGDMADENSPNHGVIPRIVNDIFNHIYGFEDLNVEFNLKVSYFVSYRAPGC